MKSLRQRFSALLWSRWEDIKKASPFISIDAAFESKDLGRMPSARGLDNPYSEKTWKASVKEFREALQKLDKGI